MPKLIIITMLALGGAFFAGEAIDAKKKAEEEEAGRIEQREDSLSEFSSAIRFVGACGVVCSLIWGGSIIVVSRNRARRSSCRE